MIKGMTRAKHMFEGQVMMMSDREDAGRICRNDGKRIYTVDEIQDILGISRPTAYKLIRRGEFRSVRAGGHIKVSKQSFDAWLDAQMV